jgi:hypothetical protein
MAAAPQEYSVLWRVSGIANKEVFKVSFAEIFTGTAPAEIWPQDNVIRKKHVINRNSVELMAFIIQVLFYIILVYGAQKDGKRGISRRRQKADKRRLYDEYDEKLTILR